MDTIIKDSNRARNNSYCHTISESNELVLILEMRENQENTFHPSKRRVENMIIEAS